MNSDHGSINVLRPGQLGVVTEVEARDSDMERLMAMGVCGGRTVELVKHGDPMILRVYGTRIGISARLAEKIRIQPCWPDACPNQSASNADSRENDS